MRIRYRKFNLIPINLTQLRIDEQKAIALGVKFDRAASLPVIIAAAITEKNTMYARLVRTAERQMAAGKRDNVPLFLAAAMSSTGFFSPQVMAFQEFLVETLSFSIANGIILLLGLTKAELLSRFRRRFRSQISCCYVIHWFLFTAGHYSRLNSHINGINDSLMALLAFPMALMELSM